MNKAIQHYDDERGIGNGIIVTLKYGYSFEQSSHLGVKGFDTHQEAREATKSSNLFRCSCDICKENK